VAEQDRSEGIIADVKSRAMVVFAGTESDLGDRLFVCGDEFTAADILAVEDFTIAAQYL
jgi:glutathione S-transferase